jgi:hypothetical protein
MSLTRTFSKEFDHEILSGIYKYTPIRVTRIRENGDVLEQQGIQIENVDSSKCASITNLFSAFPIVRKFLYPVFEKRINTNYRLETIEDNLQKVWQNFAFPVLDPDMVNCK